jgi:hypothetical protein
MYKNKFFIVKINKLRLHQTKNVFLDRRNHQQNEITVYRKGKIFANNISDKEFISTIHKELKAIQSRLVNSPIFSKEKSCTHQTT